MHAHRFRHTFATWAIVHDPRELDVQHLLGHISPDMVRRYSATYRSVQAAERHLRHVRGEYIQHYNAMRLHRSLELDAPRDVHGPNASQVPNCGATPC